MDVSRRQVVAATVAAGLASWPPASQAARLPWWPQFKGGPQRTGRSRFSAPSRHDSLWHAGGAIQSEMCIDGDGRIYSAGDSGILASLEPTGKVRWQVRLDSRVWGGTVVLHDGSILTVTANGFAHCFDRHGTPRWSFSTRDYCGAESTPLVASDGMIYLGNNTSLFALQPDGTRLWRRLRKLSGPPAEGHDGTIYFPSGQELVAITPAGRELWRCHTTDDVYGLLSAPAVGDDGVIYVGGERGEIFAVNPDGSLRWRGGTFDVVNLVGRSPAIAADGTVYFCSPFNYLNAIDPADGSIRWRYFSSLPNNAFSAPTVAEDGTIFVGDAAGRVLAISPKGKLLWSMSLNGGGFNYVRSSPVLMTHQRLLAGSLMGLFVIGVYA